ncbi:MAG: NAD(P)-dependent oxidoreductase [Hyphomicrobiales bacterium]|nr:NAD(P)-dependent oxidoreductase [Hyphomicrobiales bacterium]
MQVAVTGGTGYVGRYIVDALIAGGHEVRVLVRNNDQPLGLPKAVEAVGGGLDPDADFGALLDGAGALVHAAYQHVAGRYRGGEGDDLAGFMRVNVGGSLALLAAARHAGVGRCVVLSSRAVYGCRPPGMPLSEDMAIAPDSHYGAAKAALEAFAASFARQDGWCVCALRPTGIYGLTWPPGRSKWLGLVGSLLDGEAHVEARAGTEVHGADVARAVILLLQAPAESVAGRAFNCSDLVVSTRDIARHVGRLTGRDVPLPPASDASELNIMACEGLKALGLTFSGEALLHETIGGLIALARNRPQPG